MVLLERDLHLEALRSALSEAGDEGRVALVYGEAGIGTDHPLRFLWAYNR